MKTLATLSGSRLMVSRFFSTNNFIGILFALTLVLSSHMGWSQISGETAPSSGSDYEYTFNNGSTVTSSFWSIAAGTATIVSTSSSGTLYSAIVRWTASGAGTLEFRQLHVPTALDALNVTVCAAPAVPTGTFTYASICTGGPNGAVTITRSGTPPGGVTWYWQSPTDGATGTNTGLGSGSSINATSAGIYYLRAASSGCWSAGALATGSVLPILYSVTGTTICSGTTATISAFILSGGDRVRWYSACTGGTLLFTSTLSSGTGTYTTGTLSTTTDFYACAYSSTTTMEGPRELVTATVNPIPGAPATAVATPSTSCGTASVTLSATGAGAGEGYRWYTTSSGGSPLGSTTQSVSSTTTFYVARYFTATGCEGSRLNVTATINPIPSAPSASNTSLCGTGTITATPGSNGNTVKWYSASTGGTLLATSTTSPSTSSTTTYYMSSYHSTTTCESTSARVAVTVTINPVPGSPTASNATYCGSGTVTATPGSNGNSVRWYAASSGGSVLATNTVSPSASSTTTYYMSSYNTTTTCESTAARVAVTITINPVPGAPTASNASKCGPGNITGTAGSNGNSIKWYAASSGGSALATSLTSPTPSSTTTYYMSTYNTTTTCESTSARVAVTITINTVPSTPTPSATNSICGTGTTSATPGANGNTIRWYNVSSGGSVLATNPTSPSTSSTTTYYLSTYNSTTTCESSRVSTTLTINPVPSISVSGSTTLVYGNATQLSTTTSGIWQWKKSTVNIVGATTQTFNPTEGGSITVGVKQTGGSPECISTPVTLTSPLTSQDSVNFVSETSIMKEGVPEGYSLFALTQQDLAQVIAYKDGIGRTFQTVGVGLSPSQKDVISPVAYTKYGFVDKGFLPYVTTVKEGKFRTNSIKTEANYSTSEQYLFYQNETNVAHDTRPYSEMLHRTSPDARVLTQASPGLTTSHAITSVMTLNGAGSVDDSVRYWKATGSTVANYTDKTVIEAETTDENGNLVRTYTNNLGQTVLKKVQETSTHWLKTAYVYDNYGRLIYQIPPKALDKIGTASSYDISSNSNTDELIFRYKYDSLGRVVEKKTPGATWQYIIYDRLGRVVLTQDGNLRASNKWQFVKYDKLNRPVYSGIYTNSTITTRTGMQNKFRLLTYTSQNYFETDSANATYLGYTKRSFPSSGLTVLTANYYDHYDFDRSGSADYTYDNAHLSGTPSAASTTIRNMPTGSKKLVLGTSTWLISAVFYDQYDRVIQTQSNNHINATVQDKSTVLYLDLAGHIDKTKVTHAGGTTVSVTQRYTYDPNWRTLAIYHTINSGTEQQLVSYTYNSLGQVIDKKLHNTGGSNFMQSVDFRYNIRGALTSINNARLSNDSGTTNDDTGDYFGMELAYDTDAGMSNTLTYNGNISAVKWTSYGNNGVTNQRSYKYTYDKSERLTAATFQANTGSAWTRETNTLNESMTYDANGNIKALTRYNNVPGLSGLTVTSSATTIDNLTYTYSNNQLTKVEDSAGSTGFTNGASASNEYTYTNYGSLNKDDNKGIATITYNELGKPLVITYSGSPAKTVTNTYDASGARLKTVNYDGTTTTTTDYVGGFVYTNTALSFFASPEGRVIKNGSNYEYQYAIKDHQGNTRVLFTSATASAVAVTANMEGSTNTDFTGYNSRISFELMDHTDFSGSTYSYSQKLMGTGTSLAGVAKSYKVFAGDKVKLEAYAKYYNPSGTSSNLSGFAAALLNAFGLSAPAGGETLTPSWGINNYGAAVAGGAGHGTGSFPKIFVNILLFDKNYNLIDAAWQQIDGGEQVGTSTKAAHDYMSVEYTAKQEGYAYVFVSNENATLVEAYFDDVVATYTQSNLLQYNEYYTFGMQTAMSWTRDNVTGNNYLANGGTELNKLNNLYDLEFRSFDPVLGRMNQVDPVSDKYSGMTPYNYAFNNPAMFNDMNGADPVPGEPDYLGKSSQEMMQRQAMSSFYSTRPGYGKVEYGPSPTAWMRGGASFFDKGWCPTSNSLMVSGGETLAEAVVKSEYEDKVKNGDMTDEEFAELHPDMVPVFKSNYMEYSDGVKGQAYNRRLTGFVSIDKVQTSNSDWFGRLGTFFNKNYNRGVVYDGDAWYGTNFIGPGPATDPYRLRDTKNPGQYLKPKDMVDAAAQRHDHYYYLFGEDGPSGAAANKNLTFADKRLVDEASKAFFGYFTGDIDPITGNPISARTRDMALDIMISFGVIVGFKTKVP